VKNYRCYCAFINKNDVHYFSSIVASIAIFVGIAIYRQYSPSLPITTHCRQFNVELSRYCGLLRIYGGVLAWHVRSHQYYTVGRMS